MPTEEEIAQSDESADTSADEGSNDAGVVDDSGEDPALAAAQAVLDAAKEEPGDEEEEEEQEPGEDKPDPKAAKPPPAKAKGEESSEEDEDAGLSKIGKELRAREKARGKLAEAEARSREADEKLAKADQAYAKMQEALQEVQREKERLTSLRSKPLPEFLREMGHSAEELIDIAQREKDPAYQFERKIEDRFRKYDDALKERDEEIKRLKEKATSYDEQAQKAAVEASHKTFLAGLPQDSPALVIWEPEYILNFAYRTQEQYAAKFGRKPSVEALIEHVHKESLRRTKGLGHPGPHKSAGKPAIKSKANGSRALTQQDASQRRAPVDVDDFDDLDPEEQRSHLVDIVNDVRARARRE